MFNRFIGFGSGVDVVWATAFTQSLSANNSDATQKEFRSVISSANLGAKGGAVRITFTPVTTGGALTISAAYIGQQGASAPDFDGGQKQLLFSGSGSVSLTAGGANVVSDVIYFQITGSSNIVISYDCTTNNRRSGTQATGLTNYAKSGTSGEAGNTTTTGYSLDGNVGPFNILEVGN